MSSVKIKEWASHKDQIAHLGSHKWSVARLIEVSRDFPVMDIPLAHLNVYNTYEKMTMREMVMHIKAVLSADLDMPIIMDEDGEIMDGRHRIMKAMLNGVETIKAVRFDENPIPCSIDGE